MNNIKRNEWTLQYVLEKYKDDYNINLEAVKQNGYILELVSNKIKDQYYDINLEAVKQNGNALKYVSNNLLDNKKFIINCIKVNTQCYDYIPDKFKNDQEILELMKNNINININE